ncbi:hypothetical protein AB4Y36_39725 [Paraburkholderia sp. BR10936]|uniref:hypothetical protein n=1 Tax=Paraburkholderia sp. BR10936 TaxID=3236993 RepID=UPI0034D17B79
MKSNAVWKIRNGPLFKQTLGAGDTRQWLKWGRPANMTPDLFPGELSPCRRRDTVHIAHDGEYRGTSNVH